MNQHSLVLSLGLKRLSARANHEDIVAKLGADIATQSPVTRHLYQMHCFPSTEAAPSADIPMVMDDAHGAIMAALDKTLFDSVHHSSGLADFSSATVYRRLTQLLGYTAQHLRWIPHILPDNRRHSSFGRVPSYGGYWKHNQFVLARYRHAGQAMVSLHHVIGIYLISGRRKSSSKREADDSVRKFTITTVLDPKDYVESVFF